MRVLVVEDERKIAQILKSALQAEHYDVVVAATGEDGFYRANAELFDLVVLDLMLPGRSGLEILQTLTEVELSGIKYYWFTKGKVAGLPVLLTRTGYTGEDGFEIYGPPGEAVRVWNKILDAGRPKGLLPAGLAKL